MYVLDIQRLLLMENLNPCEHSPRPDGVSIQKNLGTGFFRTMTASRQELGSLSVTGGWHCGSERLTKGRRPLADISLSCWAWWPSISDSCISSNANLPWWGLPCENIGSPTPRRLRQLGSQPQKVVKPAATKREVYEKKPKTSHRVWGQVGQLLAFKLMKD